MSLIGGFSLNVFEGLRRLGITGGQGLTMAGELQPTLLVSDLSRQVPGPVEPRGFVGANVLPGAGTRGAIQIESLAPGGIFIECIALRPFNPAVADNVHLSRSTTDLALPVANASDFGGDPVDSTPTAGQTAVAAFGPTLPLSAGFESLAFALGLFVPNGQFFTMMNSQTVDRLDAAVVWRELPAIPGPST